MGEIAELCSVSTGDFGVGNGNALVSNSLKSRRQGLSKETLAFYQKYLHNAAHVVGLTVTNQDIAQFLDSLRCSNGGKHAYFRALRTFYNWLYSPKSGHSLNAQDNPILLIEAPKVEKRILPSVTDKQVEQLIGAASNIRDKCIISLFADSGLRLSELLSISHCDIDWETNTVRVIGKGNKQRRAPFTDRTAQLLSILSRQPRGRGNMGHQSQRLDQGAKDSEPKDRHQMQPSQLQAGIRL